MKPVNATSVAKAKTGYTFLPVSSWLDNNINNSSPRYLQRGSVAGRPLPDDLLDGLSPEDVAQVREDGLARVERVSLGRREGVVRHVSDALVLIVDEVSEVDYRAPLPLRRSDRHWGRRENQFQSQ